MTPLFDALANQRQLSWVTIYPLTSGSARVEQMECVDRKTVASSDATVIRGRDKSKNREYLDQ